jgi:hypothetical protein
MEVASGFYFAEARHTPKGIKFTFEFFFTSIDLSSLPHSVAGAWMVGVGTALREESKEASFKDSRWFHRRVTNSALAEKRSISTYIQ